MGVARRWSAANGARLQRQLSGGSGGQLLFLPRMEASEPQLDRFSIRAYDGSLDIDAADVTCSCNAVLSGSSGLCEELRHARVEPAHVAYRLFVSDQGIGRQILERAGLDPEQVKGVLQQMIEELPTHAAAFSGRGVTFSQQFVELMKRARIEQRQARDKLVGLDHLALAICNEATESLRALIELGLSAAEVRAAVDKLKLGLLREQSEAERQLRAEAEAAAAAEAERATLLGVELDETVNELSRLHSDSSVVSSVGSSDEPLARTGSNASSNEGLYDDY